MFETISGYPDSSLPNPPDGKAGAVGAQQTLGVLLGQGAPALALSRDFSGTPTMKPP